MCCGLKPAIRKKARLTNEPDYTGEARNTGGPAAGEPPAPNDTARAARRLAGGGLFLAHSQ